MEQLVHKAQILHRQRVIQDQALPLHLHHFLGYLDAYTIQLVALEPADPMLASLTLRANTLLNKDYIEKYGKELGKSVESVDGTGPFKLVEWNKDEDMHLVRHDDYGTSE